MNVTATRTCAGFVVRVHNGGRHIAALDRAFTTPQAAVFARDTVREYVRCGGTVAGLLADLAGVQPPATTPVLRHTRTSDRPLRLVFLTEAEYLNRTAA